jgi:hypothetical protein
MGRNGIKTQLEVATKWLNIKCAGHVVILKGAGR